MRARLLPTLLAGLALVASVADAKPRAAAPFDSALFRSVGLREPFRPFAAAARFGSVDSLARLELGRLTAARTRDSLVVARALVDVVETGCLNGRAREPLLAAQLQRALAIHRAHPGPDSLILARSWRVAGELARRNRDFDEALRLANAALRVFERALAPMDLDVGSASRLVATIGTNLGRGDFESPARRAVEIAEHHFGPGDPRTLPALSTLAGQQNVRGDQVHALATLERVLALAERAYGPEHTETDRSRYNVAVVAMRVGDYVRARALLDRVVRSESGRARVDSARLSNAVSAYLEVLNDLGDFDEALALHGRFGDASERGLPPGDPDLARYRHQLARTLVGCGRARAAIALFDSAIVTEARITDSLAALPILFERAAAFRIAGDGPGALRAVDLAGTLADRAGERAPSYHEVGLLWARCLDDAGRPREAVARLESSRRSAERALGPRNPILARILGEQARALTALGDSRAFGVALEGADQSAELLRTAARGFPDREALLYASGLGLGLDPLLEVAAGGGLDAAQRRAALDRVVAARSLVLDEVARRTRAARAARDPRARALLDSLGEARAVLARWLVRAESGLEQDSLRREARVRAERFERELAALGLEPASSATGSPLDRLASGDALVSFVEYAAPAGGSATERRLLAFVTRAGSAPALFPLGRARTVDSLVARWREDVAAGTGAKDLAAAERRARTSGAALRARVWDPLAAAVADAGRVVLVPDGALHLVDFSALPSAAGGYLADRPALLARLGAERDLDAVPADDAGRGLLALGGADFDLESGGDAGPAALRSGGVACERFRDVKFSALPATRLEVGDVASRWRARGLKATELTGADASETRLKQLAPSCGALHLATHGFFLGGECARSSSATRGIGGLAPSDAVAASSATPNAANALRLAGLALTGANRRGSGAGEDGVLTAEEISALDLSGVHEVVLSACDSGVGDIAAGEGVLGLQRAFRIAGARSLVMSLWPVEDAATRAWMDAYYDARLAGGAGVAASVRAADRARLAALRRAKSPTPPHLWAGFIPLGE